MRRWQQHLLTLCALAATAVKAAEYPLNPQVEGQQCTGMYAKKTWGGTEDPTIEVSFKKTEIPQILSLAIWEFEDVDYLGRVFEGEREYICTNGAVANKLCNKKQLGAFITTPRDNSTSTRKSSIYSTAIDLSKSKPILYEIQRTGYYCIWANSYEPIDADYDGVVMFKNSYGELPGSQIAKLPFYGGLTILYALMLALWGFLYWQHRQDILPVQNYITAIIIFLVVEIAITWTFYDYQNRHGNNTFSKVLLILVSIFNAGRNSFSFFLLLIVCMGYGVVKPSLGATMKWVRILALTHFVFGVIYAVASLTVTPDQAGPLVLLVILPLAATLTAFYVWTLNSLKLTQKSLAERKQHQKGLMYKRLWWVILGSIIVIFAFFFINSFTFTEHGSPDFAPTHWKTRWFVLDGWLNLVYLADLAAIAWLWRPTDNNRRFAMSDELAQDDDDGFEVGSIGGVDSDSEDEGPDKDKDLERGMGPGATGGGGSSAAGGSAVGASVQGGQPQQQRGPQRRVSVEEPIFEIGEEEEAVWSDNEDNNTSDDESSDGDKKKLVGKKA